MYFTDQNALNFWSLFIVKSHKIEDIFTMQCDSALKVYMYMWGNNVHNHAKFQVDSSIDVYFTDQNNINFRPFFHRKSISTGIFSEINELEISHLECGVLRCRTLPSFRLIDPSVSTLQTRIM